MRFLLDASTSTRLLRPLLEGLGHDVKAVVDFDRHAQDELILEIAVAEDRILITLDKDFGDLVFARGFDHRGIVRLFDGDAEQQASAMARLLEESADVLHRRAMVVIDPDRVRIGRTGA